MADTDDREPAKDNESTDTEETGKESSKKASSTTSKEKSGTSKPSSTRKRPRDEEEEDEDDEEEDDEDEEEDEDDEEPPPPPRKSGKSSKVSPPKKKSGASKEPSGKSNTIRAKKASKVVTERVPPKPVSYYLPFTFLGMAIIGAHIFWDTDYHPVAVLGIAITIWSYMGIGSANEVGGALATALLLSLRPPTNPRQRSRTYATVHVHEPTPTWPSTRCWQASPAGFDGRPPRRFCHDFHREVVSRDGPSRSSTRWVSPSGAISSGSRAPACQPPRHSRKNMQITDLDTLRSALGTPGEFAWFRLLCALERGVTEEALGFLCEHLRADRERWRAVASSLPGPWLGTSCPALGRRVMEAMGWAACPPWHEIPWSLVPAGRILLTPGGAKPSEDPPECAPREVEIAEPFLLARVPVTQGQWREIMGSPLPPRWWQSHEPSAPQPSHPIHNATFAEAIWFCNQLSEREGRAPYYEMINPILESGGEVCCNEFRACPGEPGSYRLPTSAQWEYACAAGRSLVALEPRSEAWHQDNSEGRVHPVGLLKPNPWGLYDMLGNVWEWCDEEAPSNLYTQPEDPILFDYPPYMIQRGGGESYPAELLGYIPWDSVSLSPSSAMSAGYAGFRLMRTLPWNVPLAGVV